MNNNNTPEIIRAATPLILASIGCLIGGMVIFNPNLTDARWSSGMGLAGTAITGAAGLAQSNGRSNDNPRNETEDPPKQNYKSGVTLVKSIHKKRA